MAAACPVPTHPEGASAGEPGIAGQPIVVSLRFLYTDCNKLALPRTMALAMNRTVNSIPNIERTIMKKWDILEITVSTVNVIDIICTNPEELKFFVNIF